MSNDTKQSWFKRHKILTAILGFFVFMFIVGALSGDGTEGLKAGGSASTSKKDEVIMAQPGQEIDLATYTIKVLESREANVISQRIYGTPKSAADGAKFVIVEVTLLSKADGQITFFPNDTLKLIDSQGRQFKTYDDSIGAIDDYLEVASLSPGIAKTGVILYEIPKTETAYSLVGVNKSTSDVYMVNLPAEATK